MGSTQIVGSQSNSALDWITQVSPERNNIKMLLSMLNFILQTSHIANKDPQCAFLLFYKAGGCWLSQITHFLINNKDDYFIPFFKIKLFHLNCLQQGFGASILAKSTQEECYTTVPPTRSAMFFKACSQTMTVSCTLSHVTRDKPVPRAGQCSLSTPIWSPLSPKPNLKADRFVSV